MANTRTPIKGITKRPLAVDFIDNRLPKYHTAFKDPPTCFDMELQQYVPISRATDTMIPEERLRNCRRPPSAVETMQFWASIFPEAMTEFKERSPKSLIPETSLYSIRNTKTWEEVRERLLAARKAWEGPKESVGNYFKRGLQKIGENAEPAKKVLDVVKKIQYLSPVVGSLQIILDVSCSKSIPSPPPLRTR